MTSQQTDVQAAGDQDQVREESAEGPGAPSARRGGRSDGRSRRRRRGIAAGVVLGAAGLWYVAYASPVTLVEHVVVSAPRGISEESIRLASGISADEHVPGVDAEAVRLAVMSAIPAVADVRVSRSLPSTVRLEVTARTPLAALAVGKGFYVIDAEGVVYDKVKTARRLPVIQSRTEVGRESAREVLLALPEQLRKRVTQVTARTADDVTLRLRGGATVRWGNVADSALKAQVLAGLQTVQARRYDVSVPLLPTTSQPLEDAEG